MIIEKIHEKYIRKRRIDILCEHIVSLLPQTAFVLDAGCGDGLLASKIMEKRSDITFAGIDVLLRKKSFIPVKIYNGTTFPFKDNCFDCIMFIDVLHHAKNIKQLLSEACRVSRKQVIIKDHLLEGLFSNFTLTFMDKIGNSRYEVNLEDQYLTRKEWCKQLSSTGLLVKKWNESLKLFPWPASILFDRSLHFIANLNIDGRCKY